MSPKRRRFYLLILTAVLLALFVLIARSLFAPGGKALSAVKLRCMATQDVTPFGNDILYYDGLTARSAGAIPWAKTRSFPAAIP